MSEPLLQLRREIRQAILRGVDEPWSDAHFNDFALRLFALQVERNAPYRRYCLAAGIRPESVNDWQEIPALPAAAFRTAELCCFPASTARVVFETSGTTGRETGRHFLLDTSVYDASLSTNFKAHVLPDTERIRMLVLAASPLEAPHSSLSHMLAEVMRRWGAPGSGTYFSSGRLELAELEGALSGAEAAGVPVCLMGTSFAFVHLLDHLAASGRRFRLAEGSRVMDTGGYKGRSREVPRQEIRQVYGSTLGIPARAIVNEYGMTEMCSQFYDGALGRGRRPGRHAGPPWVRTQVVDAETLKPVPAGRPGLLRHFDLANVESVLALQTGDVGVERDGGFELTGRAAGAMSRGCSLDFEALLERQGARGVS